LRQCVGIPWRDRAAKSLCASSFGCRHNVTAQLRPSSMRRHWQSQWHPTKRELSQLQAELQSSRADLPVCMYDRPVSTLGSLRSGTTRSQPPRSLPLVELALGMTRGVVRWGDKTRTYGIYDFSAESILFER